MANYDFRGWATKANLKCSDGRVIAPDAFKGDDGNTVPLIWNHQHGDVNSVLGHALLKNEDGSLMAYCSFNNSESGKTARELVKHEDICSLSICANKLIQEGPLVKNGKIREVSLVLAGANPGAKIEDVMSHDDEDGETAYIFMGKESELTHAEGSNPSEEEKKEDPEKEKEDIPTKSVQDVIDSMTEEQRNILYAMVGTVLEDVDPSESEEDDDPEGSEKGDDEEMKQNIFDQTDLENKAEYLMHSDGTPVTFEEVGQIFKDVKRYGSLKDTCIAHGIEDIEYLFPDDRNVTNTPIFIKRDTGWVTKVMSKVHHTPFSRIKSIFADITEDDARAKGYIKGKIKKEEFFSLIKRTTEPTTVYKKQKMDRDDVIDITDFDVVSWLKTEMRGMLDEELARAYLVGDGRISSSDDKIDATHIRPIATDEDLFTVKIVVNVSSGATDDDKAKAFIDATIRNRKLYKGSGNPDMFITEDMLVSCLLLKDEVGRDLYADEAALARKLRVRELISVPVMEGVTGANGGSIEGIMVNLQDYNVGADKGGAINMFDDFDIDYNQQKYLIETRCSGALTVPYSAMTFEVKES